jgi:pyruvate formate lyase activating enzyme
MKRSPSSDPTAVVFDIARNSLDDGPGIRTTVFLKGCNLRCLWCHNPESFSFEPQTVTLPNGQRKTWGERLSVSKVFEIVRRDLPFYRNSGGGMTLSGGEPLLQPEFALALLARCREAGIHTAIETNGAIPQAVLASVLPMTDLFLFDYKGDPLADYPCLTGRACPELLENLRFLLDAKATVILRCPLIPGLNDSPAHLAAIDRLAKTFPLRGVQFLPFHNTARDKWTALGLDYTLRDLNSST